MYNFIFYILLIPIFLFPLMYCLKMISLEVFLIVTGAFFASETAFLFTERAFYGAVCLCVSMPLIAAVTVLVDFIKKARSQRNVCEGIVISEKNDGAVLVFDGLNVVPIMLPENETAEKGSVVKISLENF